jgi:hypothetical protein
VTAIRYGNVSVTAIQIWKCLSDRHSRYGNVSVTAIRYGNVSVTAIRYGNVSLTAIVDMEMTHRPPLVSTCSILHVYTILLLTRLVGVYLILLYSLLCPSSTCNKDLV